MGAPKGNKNAVGNKGGVGGPEKYHPRLAEQAKKACEAGFTDQELADLLGVSVRSINAWKIDHVEFGAALKTGKAVSDERVERSLFARATGYEHDEVDIRVVKGQIVQTPIRRYYPPDTTAAIFWLKNRRGAEWRDVREVKMSREIKELTNEELLAIAAGGGGGDSAQAQGEGKPGKLH